MKNFNYKSVNILIRDNFHFYQKYELPNYSWIDMCQYPNSDNFHFYGNPLKPA